MTYLPYIVAAYSVFGVVLAWDGLTPWLRYRRVLRMVQQKSVRKSVRNERSQA